MRGLVVGDGCGICRLCLNIYVLLLFFFSLFVLDIHVTLMPFEGHTLSLLQPVMVVPFDFIDLLIYCFSHV
jgi:hypothetical protein